MNTKMKKLLGGAVVTLTVLFAFSFTVSAYEYTDPESGYTCLIEDSANLLRDEDEALLADVMKGALKYGNIMFASTDEAYDESTLYHAERVYKEHFGTQNGTMLIIDMYAREIFIFSDGANLDIFTKERTDTITDNNYKAASRGDYYACAKGCFEQIVTILDGGRINAPMKHISNALLALLIGFTASAAVVLGTMGIRKVSAKEILKSADVNLSILSLETEKEKTTKRKIESSGGGGFIGGFSGGGGHSGGGGFSGGGHSGGGSGHKF